LKSNNSDEAGPFSKRKGHKKPLAEGELYRGPGHFADLRKGLRSSPRKKGVSRGGFIPDPSLYPNGTSMSQSRLDS
jgi:hypothetical protein